MYVCRTLERTVTLVVPAPLGREGVWEGLSWPLGFRVPFVGTPDGEEEEEEDARGEAEVKVKGSCEMIPTPSLLAEPSIPRHNSLRAISCQRICPEYLHAVHLSRWTLVLVKYRT
jgi:hypothetical protein